MALSSPSSPAKKRRMRGNKKVIDGYISEARAALAAAQDSEDGDDAAASAALGLATAALEMAPRAEAAQEVQARALLALRRYRDVAELLREYIPSCSGSKEVDSSSCSAGSGAQLLPPSPERGGESVARWCCCLVDGVLGLNKGRVLLSWRQSSSSKAEPQWRYLVLGQACFHLGLMEDAALLLQTGRRLATAAFRRQSVCWSEDSFSSSSSPEDEENTRLGDLLAHVKLLLRRRAAAEAALDAGLPAEAVRHLNKVLDTRRGGVLPHPFATACLVARAAAFRAAGRPADAIADCNRALALDPAFIPALRARADVLESVGALPDSLRDLDHLKLLYDAALRDGKLPGPTWRPQGGIRFGEIAGAHQVLTSRIQELRARVVSPPPTGEGVGVVVDYYALLGVRRGCTRGELERAHLLLSLKLKPDRSTSFAERLELVDEHRDIEAVRDQARMSALFLYRMLQKGYSFIMAAILDQEAAERQRSKEAKAAESAIKQQQQDTAISNVARKPPSDSEASPPILPRAAVTMAPMSPPFQGVFCRDMAVVGNLLSRGGFPVKCQAMSC